tara:strand:- start:3383 stop:3904 length:522 start_codon:yes stop_codon:yes gene_type:complete
MTTRIIRRSFQLKPNILSDVDMHVEKYANEHVINSCSEKDGYITSIDNVTVESIDVCETTSFLNVNVNIESTCVKPKTGSKYSGRICLIFDMGILINVAGVLKVLVPMNDNVCIINEKERQMMCYSETGLLKTVDDQHPTIVLQKNDMLTVEVTGVQYNYSTNSYNCFGNIMY